MEVFEQAETYRRALVIAFFFSDLQNITSKSKKWGQNTLDCNIE